MNILLQQFFPLVGFGTAAPINVKNIIIFVLLVVILLTYLVRFCAEYPP